MSTNTDAPDASNEDQSGSKQFKKASNSGSSVNTSTRKRIFLRGQKRKEKIAKVERNS